MQLHITPTSHDYFDDLATLFIALSSVNAALTCYSNSGVTLEASNPKHALHLFGKHATFSLLTHDLMHGIANDHWPTDLRLVQSSPENPPKLYPANRDLTNLGLQHLIGRLVGSAFLRYYERKLQTATPAVGGHPREWPELLRFAWLIRNAIAHGDRFTINDQTFPTTVWKSVSVSPAMSGKQWFDLDAGLLGGGDLILLMEELRTTLTTGGNT